jgi:acetyl-CoA carboxylase carboxyl transferase subunit alpha
MKTTFLDFEQPVAELETKIEELRYVQDDSAVDISEEIDRLKKKSLALTKEIYAKLTPWQVSQVARHPQRPYTLDYLQATGPMRTIRRWLAALRVSTGRPAW